MHRHWCWLGLLGMVCAGPVMAWQTSMHQSDLKLCRSERAELHQLWQNDLYDVSPGVSAMMVAAMDGDTAAVQHALAKLPQKQRPRVRQLALDMALLGSQTATAEKLLETGADANGSARIPKFKPRFYGKVVGKMAQDPRLGGAKGVAAFKKAGVLDNGPRHGPQPLFTTIECNDVATTRLLLRRGADPMRPARPDNPPNRRGPDPFLTAVVDGNPAILNVLLAHDVRPCVDDQRMAAIAKARHSKKAPPTVASIAKKEGVPAKLVARLACHAPPAG